MFYTKVISKLPRTRHEEYRRCRWGLSCRQLRGRWLQNRVDRGSGCWRRWPRSGHVLRVLSRSQPVGCLSTMRRTKSLQLSELSLTATTMSACLRQFEHPTLSHERVTRTIRRLSRMPATASRVWQQTRRQPSIPADGVIEGTRGFHLVGRAWGLSDTIPMTSRMPLMTRRRRANPTAICRRSANRLCKIHLSLIKNSSLKLSDSC